MIIHNAFFLDLRNERASPAGSKTQLTSESFFCMLEFPDAF